MDQSADLETLASMPPEPRPRYPGAHSFSDDDIDRRLFFGRERAAASLINDFRSTRLLVLYGKSGLGKTSLLNAGVFPALRQRNFLPLRLRVNDTERTPVEALIGQIEQLCEGSDIAYTPGRQASLWEYFKTALFWRGETLLTPVAVLDQFEEVFTRQTPVARKALAEQLGQLMSGGLPAAVRERIQAGEELDYNQAPPNVKIIISLRWEYVGRLEELFPQIPAILNRRFLLQPLSRGQAEDAIVKPGAQPGEVFTSPRFSYHPETLKRLLEFLSDQDGSVEPFQLQLLCQHVERQVRRRYGARTDERDITVDNGYLGSEQALQRVLADFYLDTIGGITSPRARGAARELCERGLLSPEGNRLDLGEQRILSDYRLELEHLSYLVDQHLLRREPRLGSHSYELAHDSLAASIARYRRFKLPRWVWYAGATLLLVGAALSSWFYVNAQQARIAEQGALLEELRRKNITEERFTELLARNAELSNQLTLASEQARLMIAGGTELEERVQAGGDELLAAVENLLRIQEAARQRLTQARILDSRSGAVQTSGGILEPEMVLIEGGCFQMGSPGTEKGGESDGTQHEVCVADFYLGKYEVTFAEYDTFALASGRELPDDRGWGRGNRPVINVSWEDAVAYAQWLLGQTGKRYRLPTEAEWEYAARAGTQTAYWWGDEVKQDGKVWANCRGCGSEWDGKQTAPVGSFEANRFGLYDTAGNVWEWTCSPYEARYGGLEMECHESKKHANYGRRVIRGGSWGDEPAGVRSATRGGGAPGDRYLGIGFRLAQDL